MSGCTDVLNSFDAFVIWSDQKILVPLLGSHVVEISLCLYISRYGAPFRWGILSSRSVQLFESCYEQGLLYGGDGGICWKRTLQSWQYVDLTMLSKSMDSAIKITTHPSYAQVMTLISEHMAVITLTKTTSENSRIKLKWLDQAMGFHNLLNTAASDSTQIQILCFPCHRDHMLTRLLSVRIYSVLSWAPWRTYPGASMGSSGVRYLPSNASPLGSTQPTYSVPQECGSNPRNSHGIQLKPVSILREFPWYVSRTLELILSPTPISGYLS